MPRPKSIIVDRDGLIDDWAPLLKLRQPGFDWSGKDYCKPERGSAADRAGLALYEDPLTSLLLRAPTGFPTFASLRDTFVECDARWNVFGSACLRSRYQAARDASDTWRKMCRDVYDFAKSGVCPPEASNLIKCIDLNADTPREPSAESSRAAHSIASRPDPAVETPQFAEFTDSSSDVEIVSLSCKCPDCLVPIPGAKSGAQRHETLADTTSTAPDTQPKKRLRRRTKMADSEWVSQRSAQTHAKETPPKRKGNNKASNRAKEARLQQQCQPIVLPVDITRRNSTTGGRPKETYIMQNTAKFRYVAGLTEVQTPSHDYYICQAVEKIRQHELCTPAEVKKWLAAQLAS